jgi:hypothetical protein
MGCVNRSAVDEQGCCLAADQRRAWRTAERAERGVGAPANDRAAVWGGAPR